MKGAEVATPDQKVAAGERPNATPRIKKLVPGAAKRPSGDGKVATPVNGLHGCWVGALK